MANRDDMMDAYRYARISEPKDSPSDILLKLEEKRMERKAMEIMETAARVNLSTMSAATMSAGAKPMPADIEHLMHNGRITSIDLDFKDSRHVVRLNREEANKIFNEIGIVLKSPDVKFTEADLKWLCECFMILTDLTEQARTVSIARFAE
jgi:hypothetical protein